MKSTTKIVMFCVVGLLAIHQTVALEPNPYVNDENVRHSLYREGDDRIQMSIEDVQIPLPDENALDAWASTPDDKIALKIAIYYYKVFQLLDSGADNEITEQELLDAYKAYKWPCPEKSTPEEMVSLLFVEFDEDNSKGLSFPEMVKLMESMWDMQDYVAKMRCASRVDRAMGTFVTLFKWLDMDNVSKISKVNIRYGLSKAINKDLAEEDINTLFSEGDEDNNGYLELKEWLTLVANGKLNGMLGV